MRTIVLNGSPRRRGATAALIERLLSMLPGGGAVVEAYTAHAAPCIDCGYCREHDSCAVADGMQRVYGLLAGADAVVIASPIYFGEMTGPLLQLASRLQLVWSAARRGAFPLGKKARRGGVILTAGSDGPFGAARSTAGILLRTVGAAPCGEVAAPGTDRADPSRDPVILRAVETLAQKLSAPV